MRLVRRNPDFYPFGRELPLLHPRINVKWFYVEGMKEIDIDRVEYFEYTGIQRKGI